MAAVGSGSAKLLLFGEHAAVFGHPAIGMTLPERTTVSIDEPPGAEWDLSRVPREDHETVRQLLARLESLLPEVRARGKGSITIESFVPRGVGMGSSAAVCAALARAALAWTGAGNAAAGNAAETTRAWELAHELERLFHGTPSGVDTGLSLHEGVNVFSPRPQGLPQRQPLYSARLLLVVAAAPRTGDCGELVRGIGARVRAGEPAAREAIQKLGALSRDAAEHLGDASETGQLSNLAMAELRGLGLSSRELDLFLEEGRRAGALGGKLSGAGGGGAFFLVVPDQGTGENVCKRISSAAARAGARLASAPRIISVS